jgi:hypothetical protein
MSKHSTVGKRKYMTYWDWLGGMKVEVWLWLCTTLDNELFMTLQNTRISYNVYDIV